MGAEGMRMTGRHPGKLYRCLWAALGVLLPAGAYANEHAPARGIRQPVRLTAGSDSDFMGVVGPAGAVYFVSNGAGTLDLNVQSPPDSGPRRLSSGLGDVAWPTVSPNGRSVAYISFERDAAGDVCVRALTGANTDAETCIADDDSAELQVLWWDDESLAVLSRRGLHADFVLRKVSPSEAKTSTLLERNMVGMSLSPDRNWLAYVPVERSTQEVGVTFSNRTAKGLRLQRLGGSSEPIAYVPRLPGVTGYLAFGPRGDFLYFSQFLSDTNRDGTIDGDDNGVIFRVPLQPGATNPLSAVVEPQQLTSARWDCHYPAPSAQQLIASCSHEGSLDVYSIPLDGAVPSGWDDQRLVTEIEVARDLWTQLLLSARRLELAQNEAAKRSVLRHMTALHLALGEYESAIYYAEQRLGNASAEGPGLTWAGLMSQLAHHRRADQALVRGQLSREYLQGERARLASILERVATAAPGVDTLAQLVISEIQDDVGDKADALASLRRIDLSKLTDPLVIPLVAERAQRLYRLVGDRQQLLQVYAALAATPVLSAWYRLPWAQQFVEELERGRSLEARRAAIEEWRAKVLPAGELALMLELERVLLSLGESSDEQVREQIFAIYKREKDLARRRAVVLITLQAAARHGSEYLKYQFATSWASWLDKGHPERRYAEALYERIVLDRAYGEAAEGDVGEARGYFYGTTVSTDSLEAHIGFIEMRLAEGEQSDTQSLREVYEKRFEATPSSPERLFVEAYLSARELPREADAERLTEKVERIEALLREVQAARPREAQVHQVWGFALHQRARRTGSRQAAVSANRHYLLALDLAYGDARLRASLLHRIGLLQAALGNHGVALRYLLERDQYPHVRPLAELSLRVAIARSAWHAGSSQIAERHARQANQLLEANAELRRFRPIVLDRLALSQIDSGDAQGAWASYRALVQWQEENPDVTARNRMKARIGLAATALERGQLEQALTSAEQAREILDRGYSEGPESDWAESLTGEYRYTQIDYDALVSGLQSVASRAQGDLAASIPPLRRRIELLERQVAERDLDEDRLDLARAYQQLASMEHRRGDLAAAQRFYESGLAVSATYNENTGSPLNEPELAMVKGYAELVLFGGRKRSELNRSPEAELRRVLAYLSEFRNPLRTRDRILLETYLAMLTVGAP